MAFPGACLTVGAVNSWLATVIPCQMNGLNQHWSIQPNGQVADSLGTCLHILNGVTDPGTQVIGLNCAFGGVDEEWDRLA
ncbi:hypothetical protein AWC15_00925 [Mycobacterium lacus]|nr:hypothetical protein AWC15_00925 [Mycobacterium lacus]